jgi:hypothetical protein
MLRVAYATALRCIGQDLARRGLKAFDIRFDRDQYVAECGYQEPPASTPVSIHYGLDDIEELDRAGEMRRGEILPAGEFLNQIQIFRTIGDFLDKNEARLMRLTNNDGAGTDSMFTVEYITKDGERIVDDRAGSVVYDMCVQMYKQRGKLTGTGGRRARRRR